MEKNSNIHWLLTILIFAMLLAWEVRGDETKDIWEWTQRDFRHENGTGDFSWHTNVDGGGNPVECNIIQDFHELAFPMGIWVAPGYYRLVVETHIDKSAGIAAPNNDLIDYIEIWTATEGTPGAYIDPLQVEWVKPKPASGDPYLRQYYRGSFPTGHYDISHDVIKECHKKCLFFCSAGLPLPLCTQCFQDCQDFVYIFPTSYYQTGTFFIDHPSLFWFVVHATANARFSVGRVWLYRNVDPDPGSLKILSWNVEPNNEKNVEIGQALADYLNSPDLAAFQELSYTKRKSCQPQLYDEENCILGIMEGYADRSELNVGSSGGFPDYGHSDGDFFNVYGIGNWDAKGGHTDHYLGIITKKSIWLNYLDDLSTSPNEIYNFTKKGVGPDGDKHHHWGYGTYNCTDKKGCWHCPWPAKNMEDDHDHKDCCGIDDEEYHYNNELICRNNFYFTNDNQFGCTYKYMNGRHITARFRDRMGKEGAMADTHLIHKDGDGGCRSKDPGSLWRRALQMVDIIAHVATDDTYEIGETEERKIMYGSDFFDTNPFIITGDTNLRYDEQYFILDFMRSKLASMGVNSAVLDLTLSQGLEEEDTHPGTFPGGDPHPGNPCSDMGDRDVFDKIYLLGAAASMDNDIDFQIGNFLKINGSCCHPDDRDCGCAVSPEECRSFDPGTPYPGPYKEVDTKTDHFPVFATLSGRTTDSIGEVENGFEAVYSAEKGEAPTFDMKFNWESCFGCEPYLLGESRYGLNPSYVHPGIEPSPDGIEGMAARFGEGEAYILFPHFADVEDAGGELPRRSVTVEVWIKPSSLEPGVLHTIVAKGQPPLPAYKIEVVGDSESEDRGYLKFTLWDDCFYSIHVDFDDTSSYIEAGKWHHILVSWDGLVVKVIVKKINGIGDVETKSWEEVLPISNVQMCEETGVLQIGAQLSWSGEYQNFFVGDMDDLQIYNNVAR
jgi:hypothetical protein